MSAPFTDTHLRAVQVGLAQVQGWRNVRIPANTTIVEGYRPSDGFLWGCPDYCHSLDALKPIFDGLTDDQWDTFEAKVSRNARCVLTLSPAVLADALARVLWVGPYTKTP